MCSMTQQRAYEYQKYAEFYVDFRGKKSEKSAPEAVICQNLLQVSSLEKDRLQFCTFLPYNFLLANF
jgi:hypothetical protein